MAVGVVLLALMSTVGIEAVSYQGIWSANVTKDIILHYSKSLFKGSQISVSILCDSPKTVPLTMHWTVRQSPCANEYIDVTQNLAQHYLYRPAAQFQQEMPYRKTKFVKSYHNFSCMEGSSIHVPLYKYVEPSTAVFVTDKPEVTNKPEVKSETESEPSKSEGQSEKQKQKESSDKSEGENSQTRRKRSNDGIGNNSNTTIVPVASKEQTTHDVLLKVWEDGYYMLAMDFKDHSGNQLADDLTMQVIVKMSYGSSYISAEDWPLLIFYGVMGLVYILYGIFWLVMLACNWRDLLRVQFWIGGVIFLGMLEKAVFFGEYESLNNTGKSVRGAIILAELVSCLKRTFARMLVIVVSLGHGIVKPRLGQTFHKVLIVGFVFFILASIEACTRALANKADQSTSLMAASIPVAVTDAIICWWIFSSLLQTTRTLRLRRNVVKLSLYRHFTNTLIFSVIASVAYMIWSITQHRMKDCLTDWKELWMDEAFWHLLFSVILFIIMILWRPSANNQRYAFSPLLDAAEDDVDDDQVLNEAYEGMKMRSTTSQQRNGSPKYKDDQKEDDLKWVEDNIPSSLVDRVLPALDSDEEIMNTKFEVSKME